VRDQVPHQYKTTDKIIRLYILIFKYLERRQEDKRLWTEWYQEFPEFNLLLISSWMQFWFVAVLGSVKSSTKKRTAFRDGDHKVARDLFCHLKTNLATPGFWRCRSRDGTKQHTNYFAPLLMAWRSMRPLLRICTYKKLLLHDFRIVARCPTEGADMFTVSNKKST
jgi:hypothetical protein